MISRILLFVRMVLNESFIHERKEFHSSIYLFAWFKSIFDTQTSVGLYSLCRPGLRLVRVDGNRCLVPVLANSSRKNLTLPNVVRVSLNAFQHFGSIGSTLICIHNVKDVTTFNGLGSSLNLVDHASIDRLLGTRQIIDGKVQGKFIVTFVLTKHVIYIVKHRHISSASFQHTINVHLLSLFQQQRT